MGKGSRGAGLERPGELLMSKLLALAGATAVALASTPAGAVPYLFTLTGTDTASFTIDSSPVPDGQYGSPFPGFYVDDVPGTYNGLTAAVRISFYTLLGGGGFEVAAVRLSLLGEQLFAGDTANPTFIPGTYTFVNDFDRGGPVNDTLVISSPAVPEPATWAMFVGGLAMAGRSVRRRRARVRIA